MPQAEQLSDEGTTEGHLGALLLRWTDGLVALEKNVFSDDTTEDHKIKLRMLLAATTLLREYIGTTEPNKSTVDTRYSHLAEVYALWCEYLSLAQQFKSKQCMAVAVQLSDAIALMHHYMLQNTSM